MKHIIKEGEKNDSVRKTFECTDCGCVFTSDEYAAEMAYCLPLIRFHCTCPWCHSECAYDKKE